MSQAGVIDTGSGSRGTTIIVEEPPTPLKMISDFDDFLTYGESATLGKLAWNDNQTFFEQNDGTISNPGILSVVSLLNSPNSPVLVMAQNLTTGNLPFKLGGGSLSINFVINLTTLSDGVNTYTAYVGLSNADASSPGTEPTNGCYFKYTHSINSGQWQCVCNTAGVKTTVSTLIAGSTSFVNLGVSVNAAGTSVVFTINGTIVATIGTNIPTTPTLGPFVIINSTLGVVPQFQIDLFYYQQNLTSARPGDQGGALPVAQRTLLSSQDASLSTQLVYTNVTGYSYYVIEFFDVLMSTAGAFLSLKFSPDNGVTYVSTFSYYQYGMFADDAAVNHYYVNGQNFNLIAASFNSTVNSANGSMSIYGLGDSSLYKQILSSTCYLTSGPKFIMLQTGGQLVVTPVMNALIIQPSSGTIVSGTFNLYGIN